jgi:hypothetical protein
VPGAAGTAKTKAVIELSARPLRAMAWRKRLRGDDECFQESNVQDVADTAPISLRVCVGLAICATTIKDVPLLLSQPSKGCSKPPRLSATAPASGFASNARRRAYTPMAFAAIVTCGTVSTANASAIVSNAEGPAYTPAGFAKTATCGTIGAITG